MEIIDKIQELLYKQGTIARRKEIYADTNIGSLGMAGEDAFDFLKDYGNFYDIDFTGFKFEDYFVNDMEPGSALVNYFWFVFKPQKLKRMPLTVGHLIKVAECKKWFDPE